MKNNINTQINTNNNHIMNDYEKITKAIEYLDDYIKENNMKESDINKTKTLSSLSGLCERKIRSGMSIIHSGNEEIIKRFKKGGPGNSTYHLEDILYGRRMKKDEKIIKPNNAAFICNMCEKEFYNRSDVVRIKGGKFRCKECSKIYKLKHNKGKIDNIIDTIKTEKEILYTDNDIFNELKYIIDGAKKSWDEVLIEHKDILSKNPEIINEALKYAHKIFINKEENL